MQIGELQAHRFFDIEASEVSGGGK